MPVTFTSLYTKGTYPVHIYAAKSFSPVSIPVTAHGITDPLPLRKNTATLGRRQFQNAILGNLPGPKVTHTADLVRKSWPLYRRKDFFLLARMVNLLWGIVFNRFLWTSLKGPWRQNTSKVYWKECFVPITMIPILLQTSQEENMQQWQLPGPFLERFLWHSQSQKTWLANCGSLVPFDRITPMLITMYL